MIEEIEENSSSCMENITQINAKEIDSKDIINSPFVQKAISLFNVRKIKVKSKI